jgi:hypothetical protein
LAIFEKSSAVVGLRGTNIVIPSYSRFIILVHLIDWIEQEWSGISLRNTDFPMLSCPHTLIQESIVSFATSISSPGTVTVIIILGTTDIIQNQQKWTHSIGRSSWKNSWLSTLTSNWQQNITSISELRKLEKPREIKKRGNTVDWRWRNSENSRNQMRRKRRMKKKCPPSTQTQTR